MPSFIACLPEAGWLVKGGAIRNNISFPGSPAGKELHNQIHDLVKRLIPSEREIKWNIEMIAAIRDTIQHWLVDHYKIVDELEFYP